ncbi:MAG: class I SAM-dependent methyltransferase [Sedimentisphaerales bacterium]|nr:class I SAM-dependent methyltransferase [Sedimentisphaerales bacterium]
MHYVESFDPAILLGDRLGLTLYGMFVEAYMCGNYGDEKNLYVRFIKNFPGEVKEHTSENFCNLIDSVKANGIDPFHPVYANPEEYSLTQGSHRCSIAIQMGFKEVPFNLRFHDDRVDENVFLKTFSAAEMDRIYSKREEYISRCEPHTAFRSRVRSLIRKGGDAFRAPFSSKTKIPTTRPYQAYEALGISGKRPSALRFEIYGLQKYLWPEMRALEIGCNVGFFSLVVAPHVKTIEAFDIDNSYIEVANLTKNFLGVTNCHFINKSLNYFRAPMNYDLVISTAVHGWSGMNFGEYVEMLEEMLNVGGILLFESHEVDAEADWLERRKHLLHRFDFVDSGLIDDVDKTMYASEMREFLILRKR